MPEIDFDALKSAIGQKLQDRNTLDNAKNIMTEMAPVASQHMPFIQATTPTYESMRGLFENANFDNVEQPEFEKEFRLATIYSKTMGLPFNEVARNFDSVAETVHGESLSKDEQFSRIGYFYNEYYPSEIKGARGNNIQVPASENEAGLKEEFGKVKPTTNINGKKEPGTPLNQLSQFGKILPNLETPLRELAVGTGTVLQSEAGKARMLGDNPYFANKSTPYGINPFVFSKQQPTGNDVAKGLSEMADSVTSKYAVTPAQRAEWDRGPGGKYTKVGYYVNEGLLQNAPFMAKEILEGGLVGGGIAKITAGLTAGKAITKIAEKFPKIAGYIKTLPSAQAAGIISAIDEGAAEGNIAAREVENRGGSKEQIYNAFTEVFNKNFVSLSVANTVQFMSVFAPGRLGKMISLAMDVPIEGGTEIAQNMFKKDAVAKVFNEYMPKSIISRFIEEVKNPESFDEGLLAAFTAFAMPAAAGVMKVYENAGEGKATPSQVLQSNLMFDKNASDIMANPDAPQALKDVINKHTDDFGNIDNRYKTAKELLTVQTEENRKKLLEQGELAPEEMQRPELLDALGVKESTLEDDDLRLEVSKKQVDEIVKKMPEEVQVLNNVVNYFKEVGKDMPEIQRTKVIKVLDVLGGDIEKVSKSIQQSGIKGLNTDNAIALGMYQKLKRLMTLSNDATVKTWFHEMGHHISENEIEYDETGNVPENSVYYEDFNKFKQVLNDAKYFTGTMSDNELFSDTLEKYIEGGLAEKILKVIPQKLRELFEKIKALFTQESEAAKILRELINDGVIPERIMDMMNRAATGNLSRQEVQNEISNNPQVQEQAKVVEQVAKDVGIVEAPVQKQSPMSKFKENYMKQSPVTAWIDAHAKISAPPKNYKGGEYDGYKQNLANKFSFRNFFMGGQAAHNRPDQVAQMLADENLIADGNPDTMWEALEGEIGAWKQFSKDNKEYEQVIKQEEGKQEQKENFERDTDKQDRFNPVAFSVNDLNVGDEIVVKRVKGKDLLSEKLTVKEIDPDTMDVTLEDGERYGIQTISGEETHYAAKVIKDDNTAFQMVGLQGAGNLDKAEEATTRLDNLAIARQMEEQGKDVKAIRLATGWERGADKKWRYEIEDLKLDETKITNQTGVLDDFVLNANEIFKAYPKLKTLKTTIKIYPLPDYSAAYNPETWILESGFFDPEKSIIEVKSFSYVVANSILIHEVQHAIQYQEGFSGGGSPMQFLPDDWGMGDITESFEKYKTISGEVEANNVQKRMNFTPEERREKLISETEDVAREDQIFLENASGVERMEFSKEQTSESFNNKDKVRLDALIEQFKNEIDRESLNKEQKGIYDVVVGSKNRTIIRKSDLDILKGFVNLQTGDRVKGSIHIVYDHYSGDKGKVTAEEIVDMGKTIRADKNPEIISTRDGEKHIYTNFEKGNRFKVVVLKIGNTEDIITFYGKDKEKASGVGHNALSHTNEILPSLLNQSSEVLTDASSKILDQSSEKSNSKDSTSMQFASLPEITEQYIQAYDKLRRAENIFSKFGADYYLEKANEVKQHILGRIEEITGKVAPIGQDNAQSDSYIRSTKGRVRHMKTDKYSTEKFIDNLRNGSLKDLEYMEDELKNMSKHVAALGYNSANLLKASLITTEFKSKLIEQLTAHIKTLPREVQVFAWDKLNTLGRQKTEADAKKYLDTAIKAIEGIREKNLAYEQRGEMYDWLKLSTGKVNQSGRLAGKAVTADAIKLLRQIKEVVDLPKNFVALSMTDLENLENPTQEEDDKYTFLQIFGALKEKTPQEVAIAHSQMTQIVENGRLERKVKDQAIREEYVKQAEKVVGEITSEKGLLEGKEAEQRAAKQDRYWWKMAQGPFNFIFKHDRFSFMMNALTRKNKNVGSNQSYLKKLFNSRVNAATQAEKTEVRTKEVAYRENLMRITGSKNNKELYKWFTDQNKKVQTNIVKNITEQKVQSYTLDEAFNFVSKYLADGKLPQGMYIKPSDMVNFSTQVDWAIEKKKRGEDHQQEFALNISIDKGTPWKMTINKAQARVLWMTRQNEEMTENLFFNGYDDASFTELDKFLNDTDKAVCNWMLEQYGKNYDAMNKVYEELFNIPMPKVKNYSPFKAIYNLIKGVDSKAATLQSMTSGGAIASTANPKSTIKRVAHYRDLDIDNVNADNMYLQSIRESAHFVNWGVLARDLRGVFKKENVRNAIKETFNASKMNAVNHIVDSLIRGGVMTDKQISEVDAARSVICKLILSGKGPNLFKQMTGHAAIMGEMSVKDYVKYTGQFFLDHPIDNIKEVMGHEYLKNRWYNGFSQDLNIVLEKSKGKPGNWLNRGLELGMLPTRFGDIIPSVAGYYAAYKSCLAQGMTDAEARIEAGDIIDRTQQASNTKDLGYYQLQGSLLNLAQMFLTANRLYMTNVWDAGADFRYGKEGAGKRLGKKLLVYNVLCPLLYQAVGDVCKIAISALAGGDDYEPEWENYAIAMLTGPASGLLVVGNMFTWGVRKSFGQYSSKPDMIPGVGSLVESAYKTSKDVVTGEDWRKIVSDAIAPTGAGWLKPFVKEEK